DIRCAGCDRRTAYPFDSKEMTPVQYAIRMTAAARADLRGIHRWTVDNHSDAAADRLLEELLDAIKTLESNPGRGSVPVELDGLGIRDFRQIFVRTFRLVYRVVDHTVFVMMIADGRRDTQSLLERRLLRHR
ncbi:MAG: type II toxin-antitoxin system RelE/ParE family toxin, partial [Mesorhizobium sp.]|nr:type II toxin-antitoxin system RelE/ParE family toxin [Mesorhizobium sp.]